MSIDKVSIGNIQVNNTELKQHKAQANPSSFKDEAGEKLLAENPANRCLVQKTPVDIEKIQNSPDYQRLMERHSDYKAELNEFLKKYPKLIERLAKEKFGKPEEYRFKDPVELVIIARAFEVNPKIATKMIDAKIKHYKYGSIPCHDAYCISRAAKAWQIYPKYTEEYLSETRKIEGQTAPKYSAHNVDILAERCAKNKELTEKLLNVKNRDGERFYSAEEISSIVLNYERYPEFISELFNTWNSEKNQPYYSGEYIRKLMALHEKDPELIEKIEFHRYYNSGFEFARFTLDDKKELIELRKKHKEALDFIIDAKSKQNYQRQKNSGHAFWKEQFNKAIEVYEKRPELMKMLIESPNTDFDSWSVIDIIECTDKNLYPLLEKIITMKDAENPSKELKSHRERAKFDYFLLNLCKDKELIEIANWNKDDVNSLSKTQRRKLLEYVLTNKANINPDFKKVSSLLPQDQDEYASIVKTLGDNLNITEPPLNATKQKSADIVINMLVNGHQNTNALVKSLSKYIPEIENISHENINIIKTITQNPEFKELTYEDKKVMILASLLYNVDKYGDNPKDSAFDAYFIAKRLNLSDNSAQKLYKVIESSNLIEEYKNTNDEQHFSAVRAGFIEHNDKEDFINLAAFKLKEDNHFKLAQMFYSRKAEKKEVLAFDNLVENKIKEMKSADFLMPQTSAEEYNKAAKEVTVEKDGKTYKVKVAKASDIKDLCAYAHTPEAGYVTKSPRSSSFANFDAFKNFVDDKVICACYITNDNPSIVNEYRNGFILEADNDKQYVGYGRDIYSLSKKLPDMLAEYYSERSRNGSWNIKNIELREFMSDFLKSELYGVENFSNRPIEKSAKDVLKNKIYKTTGKVKGSMTPEIQSDINQKYTQRLEHIKQELNGKPMTLENLETIDAEFADVYKRIIRENKGDFLSKGTRYHNEFLISNPRITAICTTEENLENMPVEYLEMAQERNLPIVVFEYQEI